MTEAFVRGFEEKCAQAAVNPQPLKLLLQHYKSNPRTGQKDFEHLLGGAGLSLSNLGGNLTPAQLQGIDKLVLSNPRRALNAMAWHRSQGKNPYGRFNAVKRTGFNLLPKYLNYRRQQISANPQAWQSTVQTKMPKLYSKAYPAVQPGAK